MVLRRGVMRKQAILGWILVLCLAFGVCAATSFGQAVYGSIIGTVTDPQGNTVAGGKVTVTSITKGTSQETTTNDSGNYSVTHLIPDTYKVKVEAPGFKTHDVASVQVSADAAARVDAQLQVGAVTQTVEVTGEVPQLKTDRADVSIQFNEKYVSELPLLNRNFTNLQLLSPGTQKLVGWSHAATENPQGAQQIFVNGQHFSGTAFELDGTDNQDPILGIIVVNPNLDAVQESKISQGNFDAEFGKAVAGIVTIQTKSGTNDFHGTGFYYWRGDGQQACDPFSQCKPDPVTGRLIPSSRWQQFGGTFGGPILKDKLFFFGDYQGTRQSVGTTNTLTIPTQRVLQTCIAPGDGSGFCQLDQYAPFFGNGKAGDPSTFLYDRTTSAATDGSGRSQFLGPGGQPNWIPLPRISPVAQSILKLYQQLTPSNTQVTNNFVASGSGPFSQNSFDTRVDYTASSTVNVFGRFSLARFSLSGGGSLGTLGGVGLGQLGLAGSSVTHNYSLATGFTKTFSSSLLTDFRFGWFKYNPTTHKPDEGKTPAKDVGIPNVNFGDVFTSGWPSFQGDGPNSQPGVWSAF